MEDYKLVERVTIAMTVLFVIGGIASVLISPKFEKDAFNKFRDPNQPKATYWDAVFSDLRITSE